MYEYFQDYCREAGISFDDLLALGRRDRGRFAGTVLDGDRGLQNVGLSQRRQPSASPRFAADVGRLVAEAAGVGSADHLDHQRRASCRPGSTAIWPDIYDQYLQPDWREGHAEPKVWDQIAEIPDAELWEAHRRRKRRLVAFVRERAAASAMERNAPAAEVKRLQDVLDPEALTIGFARRFATYKRATLMFRDLARLQNDSDQCRHAGADRDRRQSASAGYPGQDSDPGNRAVFARRRIWRSTLCSSRITEFKWRANWCRASISG